jgi:hypothetical protein
LRTLVQPIREEASLVLKVIDTRLVAIFGMLPTLRVTPFLAAQALRITAVVNEMRTLIAEEVRPTL